MLKLNCKRLIKLIKKPVFLIFSKKYKNFEKIFHKLIFVYDIIYIINYRKKDVLYLLKMNLLKKSQKCSIPLLHMMRL